MAGPAGAAHVDADRGAGGAERGALGEVVLQGPAVVTGGRGAVGVDHAPPGHRAAVGGHDLSDLTGAGADRQVRGDVAIGHDPAGRDGVHQVKDLAGEVVDGRGLAVETVEITGAFGVLGAFGGHLAAGRHRLPRRSRISWVAAAADSASEVSASRPNRTSWLELRGRTGAGGRAPWYFTVSLMLASTGRTPASRPARVRAAAAFTMPKPTWLL